MEAQDSTSPPGSPTPAGAPLQVTSPDRVNRCESRGGSIIRGQSREGTVHDKISQFNNLSASMQSQALERKTADAALKRALIGREEAEAETKRLKEEARALRKAIDDGKERERRVGERLEAVMENFGRAKETHAHTQALWEKEIRRSRKENFKAQSSIVKLQEELKASRESMKTLQGNLQEEKTTGHGREHESVASNHKLAEALEALNDTKQQVSCAESQTAVTQQRLECTEEQLARAEQQLEKTVHQLENTERQLQSTKQQLESTQQRLEGIQDRVESVQRELEDTQERAASAQQQLQGTRQQLRKAQSQLQSTREQLDKKQEQLDSTRAQNEKTQEDLDSTQEQLDKTQEDLSHTREQVKLVEQERDAYKAAAKNEEIARIAAEGRIPLPGSDNDDELASPPKKKARRGSFIKRNQDSRASLTSMEIVPSAASELEIEELGEQVEWERQRADRAQEMIEFMQAECLMHCCPCSKSKRRTTLLASQEQASLRSPGLPPLSSSTNLAFPTDNAFNLEPSNRGDRGCALSPTIFPREGLFSTISKPDAIALKAKQEAEIVSREPMDIKMDAPALGGETDRHLRLFARTPSVEPPTFALHGPERTSLLSLINAPQGDAFADAVPVTYSIPTLPDTEPAHPRRVREEEDRREAGMGTVTGPEAEAMVEEAGLEDSEKRKRKRHEPQWSARANDDDDEARKGRQPQRPIERSGASHKGTAASAAASYATRTVTTTVPLRKTATDATSFFAPGELPAKTFTAGSNASLDLQNTGTSTRTVSREQALAMIRERRGRARSATQPAPGPSLKSKSKERRDVSAPTGQAAKRQRRS